MAAMEQVVTELHGFTRVCAQTLEEGFMNDLEHVEKDLEQDLKLGEYKEEVQKRAKKLYY